MVRTAEPPSGHCGPPTVYSWVSPVLGAVRIISATGCVLLGRDDTRQDRIIITREEKEDAMTTIAERPTDTEARTAAFAAFQRDYPAFETTRALDDLRATEYARLDGQGHVYLDYTGGGLYAESQLRDHLALLQDTGLRQSRTPRT